MKIEGLGISKIKLKEVVLSTFMIGGSFNERQRDICSIFFTADNCIDSYFEISRKTSIALIKELRELFEISNKELK